MVRLIIFTLALFSADPFAGRAAAAAGRHQQVAFVVA